LRDYEAVIEREDFMKAVVKGMTDLERGGNSAWQRSINV